VNLYLKMARTYYKKKGIVLPIPQCGGSRPKATTLPYIPSKLPTKRVSEWSQGEQLDGKLMSIRQVSTKDGRRGDCATIAGVDIWLNAPLKRQLEKHSIGTIVSVICLGMQDAGTYKFTNFKVTQFLSV
jgi:hypothetical protein